MQAGLTPREASDRQILFQNRFDGMWRKLQAYQSGEELFGLPITDYPELSQIRKELNLLQKLYKLYNDVIDRVSSYYDIPWGEVNNFLRKFYAVFAGGFSIDRLRFSEIDYRYESNDLYIININSVKN